MNALLLYIAFGLILFVSFFHSFVGQKRLIGPLLEEANPILDDPTWRAIILFGWHSTTALMILIAIYLGSMALGMTEENSLMIYATGLTFIGLGIANAIMAKFKHPGWILLSSIGISSILSLYL